MTDGEWVVKQCSFIPLLPSESPSPSSNAGDKARRGPPHKSLLVCEHSCRGDEKDEQHCMCVCTYSAFFSSFRSLLLSSLALFHLLAFRLLQPVMITSLSSRSALSRVSPSLSLGLDGRRRRGQIQMAERGCGWTFCWRRLDCHCAHSRVAAEVKA